MFTGLISCVGEVSHVTQSGPDKHLTIAVVDSFSNFTLGESIAVNGACLTVESYKKETFTAFASEQTLKNTTLGDLTRSTAVNLERALSFGDRVGGHLVSGHVDTVAEIETIRMKGNSKVLRVCFPKELSAQVILKGSVALDGISLTVTSCGEGFLEVNIIPESQASTTINQWSTGRRINFETDLIGKYVQRMLFPHTVGAKNEVSSPITQEFLQDNGFY